MQCWKILPLKLLLRQSRRYNGTQFPHEQISISHCKIYFKLSYSHGGVSDSTLACGVSDSALACGVSDSALACGVSDSALACGVSDSAQDCGVSDSALACGVSDSPLACGVSDSSLRQQFQPPSVISHFLWSDS